MLARRTVLLSGLALASAGLPVQLFAQTEFSLADFVELSARLTGQPAARLDQQAAHFIFDVFSQRGLLPDLARLAGQVRLDDIESPLANELVAAWYSGVCITVSGSVVATYTSALMWAGASFLHPSGTCGGPTGYWGDQPSP